MIFVWRGLGFLVPVLVFGCSLLMNAVTNATMGDGYYDEHGAPVAFAFALAAVVLWFLGQYLEKKNPVRVLVDKESNQEFHFQKRHDFFYIKIKYWAFVAVAFGVFELFTRQM